MSWSTDTQTGTRSSAAAAAIHAKLDRIPPPPQPGLTSFALNKNDEFEVPDGFLAASFYRRLGTRAVRLDILERMEEADDDRIGEDVYQTFRFDLCPSCRKKFIKSPLGQGTVKHFDFSEN